MGDIKKSIKWMEDHHRTKGNYPYSMYRRHGNPGFDCSSSVYYALIAGGFLPRTTAIGNTETLFALARQGKVLKEIFSYDEVQPGDIFIRGGEGTSLGAKGHTGMFYKKDGIIHSNYSNNGISKNDLSSYLTYFLDRKRSRNERYFRPIPQDNIGKAKPTKSAYEVAKEVLEGKWGVGQDRVRNLENAGYNYKEIQDRVNQLIKAKPSKTIGQIAKEVIDGKWGNGSDRANRLKKAGYDPNKVQAEVNKIVYKPVYYEVKRGDTLSSIAKKHNLSLDEIIKRNPQISNPNVVKIGQKIKIK